MLIKQIYIVILQFPVAHYISNWRSVTKTSHLIVFLLTDTGIIGIGEGTPYWSSITEDYVKAISLAKKIQGLSLEDALSLLRTSEYGEFRRKERVNYGTYLALESAVLHALSQSKGARYEAEILGGVYRREIPVAYTIFLNHPKIMADKLEHAIRSGYKHVKFKIPCSLDELEKQLQILHSTRKRYGEEEVVLRADANECFSTVEKAEKVLSIMERYGVSIVEQPMPRDMLKDIAKLKKKFYPSIEVMLDESLQKPSDIELFAQMEAANAVNFHPSKLGCLTITREVILKAQKLGMKANIGSALMAEIGLFHYLNLAVSLPHLDYPLEEIGLYNLYGYSILQNPLEMHKGVLHLQDLSLLDLNFDLLRKFVIKKHSILIEQIRVFLGKAIKSLRLAGVAV